MTTILGLLPVTLGTLDLLATDGDGVDWVITDLKGWDSAGVRADMTPRQADHGAWASPVYLDARPIAITGSIDAPNRETLDAAIEQLVSAVSLTDTLLVVGESIPKQAVVRRSGQLLIERRGLYSATYSLLVTAADPRRYSTTLQSQSAALPSVAGGLAVPITLPIVITATTASGSITLVNEGSIATRPTLTVTGPTVGGFTIVATLPDGTTTQQTYTDTLNTGDSLVLDAASRQVTLNSQVSRRLYLSGTWPEIPPQSQVDFSWTCPAYDAGALLTGTARSAWM